MNIDQKHVPCMESLAVRNSQVPEFDPSGGTFDFQIIDAFQSMENLQHIYTRYQYSISHQIYILYIVYLYAKIVGNKIFTLTCLSSSGSHCRIPGFELPMATEMPMTMGKKLLSQGLNGEDLMRIYHFQNTSLIKSQVPSPS